MREGNSNKILDHPKVCLCIILINDAQGNHQRTRLNQLIFKFVWKGVDKVTRLSVINDYEKSGLKMIDLETMAKYLR